MHNIQHTFPHRTLVRLINSLTDVGKALNSINFLQNIYWEINNFVYHQWYEKAFNFNKKAKVEDSRPFFSFFYYYIHYTMLLASRGQRYISNFNFNEKRLGLVIFHRILTISITTLNESSRIRRGEKDKMSTILKFHHEIPLFLSSENQERSIQNFIIKTNLLWWIFNVMRVMWFSDLQYRTNFEWNEKQKKKTRNMTRVMALN